MRVLAFDPGHITGVAFIVNGVTQMVSVINSEQVTQDYLGALYAIFLPKLIAIETAPYSVLTDVITVNLIRTMEEFGQTTPCTICKVPPGLWKPVSNKPDLKWAIHGADALGLARYVERIHRE